MWFGLKSTMVIREKVDNCGYSFYMQNALGYSIQISFTCVYEIKAFNVSMKWSYNVYAHFILVCVRFGVSIAEYI